MQNRVAAAISSLPPEVQLQGVTTKKKSTSILEFVVLTSPDSRFDFLFLSNYAVINVQDELRRLPGVGDVTVLGTGQYAMRIWLDPNLLQARGLVPQDVINVIQQQSQEVAAGQIGAPPTPKGQDFQYTLDLKAGSTIRGSSRISSSRSIRPTAAASPGYATSGAPSSARRLIANRSIWTAGPAPA